MDSSCFLGTPVYFLFSTIEISKASSLQRLLGTDLSLLRNSLKSYYDVTKKKILYEIFAI
jgi:hypothetical protein